MNKKITDAKKRAVAAARAAGHKLEIAAGASGKITLVALIGKPEEKFLCLSAQDPIHDFERTYEASNSVAALKSDEETIPCGELAKLFRSVGIAVWKLAGRMLDEKTKEPKDEYRRLWRHVEAVRDALAEIGVDVIDWTGKRYVEGMSLNVVSEEERPGTKEPEIIETLLPTIRFRKQIQIQQGEVVVSRPAAQLTNAGRAPRE